MAQIIEIKTTPKDGVYKMVIDGRKHAFDDILEKLRENARSKVYWMRTDFRDLKHPKGQRWGGSPYQKRWPDTYPEYTIWFTTKRDAAIFRFIYI